MSLNGILNTAISGIMTNQAVSRLIAENVANVSTPNYARRVYQTQHGTAPGAVDGVSLAQVRRAADRFITAGLLTANGNVGRDQVIDDVLKNMQGSLFRLDDQGSIGKRLDKMMAAISQVGVDPTSLGARRGAVQAISDFADTVSRLTGDLNDRRTEAERQIGQVVGEVNALLDRLGDLNSQFRRAQGLGNDTMALEDLRDSTLSDLSKLVDIRVTHEVDGTIGVSTTNGVSLVGVVMHRLDYSVQSPVTSSTRFEQIRLRPIDANTGTPMDSSRGIDDVLGAGKLRGWLDLRDDILPQMQMQLGELAAGVDALNAESNRHSPVPPPQELKGRQTGLLAADVFNTTGATYNLSLSVVDASGMIQGNVRTVRVTAGMTVDQMVTAVNAALGTDGTATFADGRLTLRSAGAGTGIVVQDDAANGARAGRGFSHFFGLNDIFQGVTPLHFQTGLTRADAHGLTGGPIDLELRAPGNQVLKKVSITPRAGGTMGDLVDALNDRTTGFGGFMTFSLDASGQLVAAPSSGFEKLSIEVAADTTTRGTTGMSFSSLFGLGGRGRIEPATNLRIAPNLADRPDRLPTALLTTTGRPNLAPADGAGVRAYQAFAQKALQFDAAGTIPRFVGTLSQYTAAFVTAAAQGANDASARLDYSEALGTELGKKQASVSGVNSDEELANLSTYQRAHNACGRLVTSANDMYDALLRMVG